MKGSSHPAGSVKTNTESMMLSGGLVSSLKRKAVLSPGRVLENYASDVISVPLIDRLLKHDQVIRGRTS